MMEELSDLLEFFGVRTLSRVNHILLMTSLEERPDWLEKRPKLKDLPRWNDEAEFTIPLPKRMGATDVGTRLIWVVEQLKGGWNLTPEGFHFEQVNDAIHFKLRWS